MNTAQGNPPKKIISRIPRIFVASAVLGIACAAGMATAASAASATPTTHVATKTTASRSIPAYGHGGHGGDEDGGCEGVIVLLCN
ncbi:hypothetical protein AB0D27_02070 [Streptomyces sp. NPDC048415]|uniref:hypothetical protein n=1 Tax=Streptomyces sp. NPDC048415 TaxID=3154822 RepID=UPI003414DF7C